VKSDGAWAMVTSDGPQPITHEFQDDIGGLLTFVEYRAEPDARLHLEPKQPGQSSLAQLQTAAAKVEAQARANRQHERRQVLIENQPDPRKVSAAMRVNAEYAALKRPRGKGAAFVIGGEE